MCESTIPLVTDAALIDPFIKLSDNVIATDLNMFKYRQVMPGITLYSLIDLFPNYMGLKHHFLAKSSTNGETFCNGDVFDDRMFLFSFISKENDVSMNKVILIFIKCSVIKECVQYESEHKGDHSLRNSLFSIKSSFFFEDCDAKFWSMTKTATICKNYNNIVFAAMKSVLSGQFVIDLESLSYVIQPEAGNTVDVDGITQSEADNNTDADLTSDSIEIIELDATVDVEATTPKPKSQRLTAVMQSLLYSSDGGITSGKRNRTSVNEKLEAAELAAQQAAKARQMTLQQSRAKGKHFLLLHNATDNNDLYVNRERSEEEEIR